MDSGASASPTDEAGGQCFAVCPICSWREPTLCKLKRWHRGPHVCYEGHLFDEDESDYTDIEDGSKAVVCARACRLEAKSDHGLEKSD